jgi:hypothetical protein
MKTVWRWAVNAHDFVAHSVIHNYPAQSLWVFAATVAVVWWL